MGRVLSARLRYNQHRNQKISATRQVSDRVLGVVLNIGSGVILHNRYEVLAELGEGGFAKVFRGFDSMLQREVAIKIAKISKATNTDLQRFEREAQLLGQLSHINIISVFSFHPITDDGIPPVIVTEYLKGQSLRELIRQSGRLQETLTFEIIRQVCAGMLFAHKLGIVHRDLSSSNIFLEGDPTNPTVKILDFGLSRLFCSSTLPPTTTLTETGMMLGNPSYMSPEIIRGEPVDNRADIYALGCIIYECLSGELPFTANNPISLLYMHTNNYPKEPSVTPNSQGEQLLKTVALRCLQKDPDKRFQSCEEIMSLIENQDASIAVEASLSSWRKTRAASSKSLPRSIWICLFGSIFVILLCRIVLSNDSFLSLLNKYLIATTHILDSSKKDSLANFLLKHHRYASARELYRGLELDSDRRDDRLDVCRYKMAVAETFISEGNYKAFITMIPAVMDSIEACKSGAGKNKLIMQMWYLLHGSDGPKGPSRHVVDFEVRLLRKLLDQDKIDESSTYVIVEKTLEDCLKTSQLNEEQLELLGYSFAKSLKEKKINLTRRTNGLLSEWCNLYMNLPSTGDIWKAKIAIANFAPMDFTFLKRTNSYAMFLDDSIVDATRMDGSWQQLKYADWLAKRGQELDKALILAGEVAERRKDFLSEVNLLRAQIYLKQKNYRSCLDICDRLLMLKFNRPRLIDVLAIRVEAFYGLKNQSSLNKCTEQMLQQLWEYPSLGRFAVVHQYRARYGTAQDRAGNAYEYGHDKLTNAFQLQWSHCVQTLLKTHQFALARDQLQRFLDLTKKTGWNYSLLTRRTLAEWRNDYSNADLFPEIDAILQFDPKKS